MSPTPRAALLVAAFALGALFLPIAVSLLGAAVVLTLAAYDAFSVRRPPRIDRTLPATLARGVAVPFAVETDGGGAVAVRQPNVPALEFEPQQNLGGVAGAVLPRLRGRHRVPAAAAVTTGALGLGRWSHAGGAEAEVLVYPDLPAARRIARSVREGRFGDPGGFGRGPLGLGTEFESIREYVADDDFRQINWRATARVGRPMTNQYRVEQDRDVVCVVDCGRLMGAPLGPARTRLDAALDATVAVALVADEVGDRCGAIAFDGAVRREIKPSRSGGRRVVAALFDLEPVEVDSDYELAFRTVAGGKRSLVMVFTDLIDEAAARSLLAATPVLARRHMLVVASVSDPDLDVLVDTPPQTAYDAAAQRVAREVLKTRAAVSARLGGMGATVIDVAPMRFSAACVSSYLKAKSRGRL